MATIIKRGPYHYQAKVRRNGYPLQTKTFELKQDTLDWAAMIESERRRGVFVDPTELEHTTLGGIIRRYKREIAPTQKGYVSLLARLKTWITHPLAKRTLVSSASFYKWRASKSLRPRIGSSRRCMPNNA